MKDDEKRCTTAFGVAIAIHVVVAIVIGFFGYRFITKPPQILEVALVGGGGAPEEVIEEQQIEEKTVVRSIEDIIDKKLKPETRKIVTKKPVKKSANPNPNPVAAPSNSTATGEGSGGSGSGGGYGDGVGEGSGRGVPVTPPRVVSSVQPKYPSSARNQGIEGVVAVKMLVGSDGRVEDATVVGSSGNGELDAAAINAVYKWRFSPAKDKFGQKARCYVTQGIRFDLRR